MIQRPEGRCFHRADEAPSAPLGVG